MLIAQAKRADNIAEYVLYMFQVEDLIRAHRFDIEALTYGYIHQMVPQEELRPKVVAWYEALIASMRKQKIETVGHVQEVQEVLIELFYLHNSLLNVAKDQQYIDVFRKADDHLREFRKISGASTFNDIETCFNALYGKLMLRLQGKEISPETEVAMQSFSAVLAHLAKAYHQSQAGTSVTSN